MSTELQATRAHEVPPMQLAHMDCGGRAERRPLCGATIQSSSDKGLVAALGGLYWKTNPNRVKEELHTLAVFRYPSIGILMILMLANSSTWAQRYAQQVEPGTYQGQFNSLYAGAWFEGWDETVNYRDGTSSHYTRYFEGPLIGINYGGFLYHPDLFTYTIAGDGTIGWVQETTTTSTGGSTNRSELHSMGNGGINLMFLANKPYASTLYASQSHTYQEYDFFNKVTVDSVRFGGTSGYNDGPVPVHVSFSHLNEDTRGFTFQTSLQQTTVSLDAHNDRQNGRTTFTYNFDDFTRNIEFSAVEGTQQTIGLSDTENFGAGKNIEWNNMAAYTIRDFIDTPGDVITAGSHLRVEHTPDLMSLYDANYLRDVAEPTVSENVDGSAGLRHQLFESLNSGLRVQGLRYTTERPGSDFESRQVIGTWSEIYTKRISDATKLTLSGSLGLSHIEQKSKSIAQIVGEAHTFTVGPNNFFLNIPNVIPESIEMFDAGRTIRYTLGIDYSVSVIGARALIQLLTPNPSGLTATTPVVVDYQASPQGSGSIDGRFADAEIRFDFFHNMLGVYARYNNASFDAPPDIIVQDVEAITFGLDYTRTWLRAGAEYEIYDSSFTSYNSARLFQTLMFTPDEVSTLSINFAEGFTQYHSEHEDEQYYSAIGRYHRGLTRHLGFDFEAGATKRTGSIINELLAAARPALSYVQGKLTVKSGYEFEYRDLESSEQRERHYFFFRAERAF